MNALIDELGRVELPDLVRTQLGVKPGDTLSLDEEDGKWFLQPVARSVGGEIGTRDVAPSSIQAWPETPLASGDDLSWEELDYVSVPLKPVAQIKVRIEPAGSVKPIPHDLDEE
jgi:hypothetical protein